MTSHGSKLRLLRETLKCRIADCKKCGKIHIDMMVIFAEKLPEVVINNMNSFIECSCSECTFLKRIMKDEPDLDLLFHCAIPKKSISEYFNFGNVIDFTTYYLLHELHVLAYYCYQLYYGGSVSLYLSLRNKILNKNFREGYSLDHIELRELYKIIINFRKSLMNKTICNCGSVVLTKGMKKHLLTTKHIDWTYEVMTDVEFGAEMYYMDNPNYIAPDNLLIH
jgi:hypothetical protein